MNNPNKPTEGRPPASDQESMDNTLLNAGMNFNLAQFEMDVPPRTLRIGKWTQHSDGFIGWENWNEKVWTDWNNSVGAG